MDNQETIFFPMLAQVLLTALVWIYLYRSRVSEMRTKGIGPQALSDSAAAAEQLRNVLAPADNFRNLFELPVLFFVAVLTLYVTASVDSLSLALASLFVALRCVHSVVHVTYNRVMHRFIAYAASSAALWALWIVIGFKIFASMRG